MTTECIRRPLARYTTCRCDKCEPVVRRMYKLQRAGKLDRPSSEAAWERIDQWIADGYTATWIATATGTPQRSIESALSDRRAGKVRVFGPERARLILTGDITKGTRGYCSAKGARRRLQALAVGGWSGKALQDESGIHFVTLACIQRGATERVRADLHHQIRELYDRLSDVEGPSPLAATAARNRGWEPAFAWDNPDTDPALDEIDTATFDEVRVQRVLAGIRQDCNPAEKEAVIAAWTGTRAELQRITGWNIHRMNKKEAA